MNTIASKKLTILVPVRFDLTLDVLSEEFKVDKNDLVRLLLFEGLASISYNENTPKLKSISIGGINMKISGKSISTKFLKDVQNLASGSK